MTGRAIVSLLMVTAASMVAQGFGRFTYPVLLDAINDDVLHSYTRAGVLGGVTTIGIFLRSMEDSYFDHLPAFRRADIDFAGIQHVGHSFADEVFRVFARRHPGVELAPVGMAPQVMAMVGAIQRLSAGA